MPAYLGRDLTRSVSGILGSGIWNSSPDWVNTWVNQTLEIGKSSCTLACDVRSIQGDRVVCSIEKMVYIRVNKYGLPKKHGGMSE